ncbi:Uncharacterised protein [Mycoplasmopsis glycophila]|uniref:PrgI family protein n=1 Tax=Mycoplasmopsis glycophila TaxID=171285 RepID=A0A449AUZ2_9BACT|nr:Uncharacterised protein [Mycoplasmopsis glycophila]
MKHTNKDLTKISTEVKFGLSFKEFFCFLLVSCFIFFFWSLTLKSFSPKIKFAFIFGSIIISTFFFIPFNGIRSYKWLYKALVFLFSKRKYKKQELNQLIPYKNIINDNVLIYTKAILINI